MELLQRLLGGDTRSLGYGSYGGLNKGLGIITNITFPIPICLWPILVGLGIITKIMVPCSLYNSGLRYLKRTSGTKWSF